MRLPATAKFYSIISPSEHIQGPFKSALEDGRIRSMPNSFLPPLPNPKAGVLLLGDAFNMRHPLTGAGMSVALNDTLIWRDMLREVPDLKDYRKVLQCLSSFQRQRRTSHSFVVNVLAQALYALFSASDGKICNSLLYVFSSLVPRLMPFRFVQPNKAGGKE